MQKRYWNYLDEDSSFDLSQLRVPLTVPGRYRGFDSVAFTGNNGSFTHDETGYRFVGLGQVITEDVGAWVTNQGVLVTEDDAIVLTVANNVTDSERIDIIVGTHDYVQAAGGAQASYSIVQGVPGDGQPSLPTPATDVLLGVLKIAPNTVGDLSSVVWIPVNVPSFANDGTLPHTNTPNSFGAANDFCGVGANKIIGAEFISSQFGTLGNLKLPYLTDGDPDSGMGNFYEIQPHSSFDETNESISLVIGTLDGFPTAPEGWKIHVNTPYRIDFSLWNGSNNNRFIAVGDPLATTSYTVPKDSWFSLISNGNGRWYIGDAVLDINRNMKIYGQLKTQQAVAQLSQDKKLGGLDGQETKGNVWLVELGNGVSNREISFIHAPQDSTLGGASSTQGRIIILNFENPETFTLKNNVASPPSNYKPILCGQDMNLVLQSVVLFETQTHWKVANLNIHYENQADWSNFTQTVSGVTYPVQAQYRVFRDRVSLRGQIRLPAGHIGKIASLSTLHRPTKDIKIPVILRHKDWDYGHLNGGASNSQTVGMVTIQASNGEIHIESGTTVVENDIYIDGWQYDKH